MIRVQGQGSSDTTFNSEQQQQEETTGEDTNSANAPLQPPQQRPESQISTQQSSSFDHQGGIRRTRSRARMDLQQQQEIPRRLHPVRQSSTSLQEDDATGNTATTAAVSDYNNTTNHHQRSRYGFRSSYVYILISAIIAFLAIISPPKKNQAFQHNVISKTNGIKDRQGGARFDAIASVEQVAKIAVAAGNAATSTVLNDFSGGEMKEKPRLLKYAADVSSANSVNQQELNHNEGSNSQYNMVNNFRKKNRSGNNEQHHNHEHSEKKDNTKSVKKARSEMIDESIAENDIPQIFRWLFFLPHGEKNKGLQKNDSKNRNNQNIDPSQQPYTVQRILNKMIDPSLLNWIRDSLSFDDTKDTAKTATHIFDKIIHSTPRLLAIANLLLAGTYLLHSAVADFFLGEAHSAVRHAGADFENGNAAMVGIGGVGASTSNRIHRSGRERLGGYLLFKLLLISAVVEPDTLDLLILLSWYTLLSFLKSLSFLAGVTTAHAAASGQMPHKGVFNLLLIVLFCDLSAAATCTALFHSAGWGMVILLTCDCALLVLDVLTHLTRYFQQVLDERHQSTIVELESRQIRMFEMSRNEGSLHDSASEGSLDRRQGELTSIEYQGDEVNEFVNECEGFSIDELHILSRQLDHEMELHEATNSQRLAILDHIAFFLEIFALMITTCHFVHIWSLHGIAFTLVDGVLALHLHSAVSAISKKLAERRNHNRIVRDLDNFFEDVTDLELKKACASGDVCCICLGTMSMGNVKKIGCGHIFHTNCLREVVERARSLESARCPLCRQSVVDGGQIPTLQSSGMPEPFLFGDFAANNQDIASPIVVPREMLGTNRVNVQQDDVIENRNNTAQDVVGEAPISANTQQNQNERALFRFSTEGILPAWLPLPAFSFEIVRRPPLGADIDGDNVVPARMQPRQNNQTNIRPPQQQNQQEGQPQSFWRRLLILAGAIPLSPEEEASALIHLVDMFPQYERADLLRELRERGSTEAVVESILAGIFTGIDRGAATMGVENIVNQQQQQLEELEVVNSNEEIQMNDIIEAETSLDHQENPEE